MAASATGSSKKRRGEVEIGKKVGSKVGDGVFLTKVELAVVMDGAESQEGSLFISGGGQFAGGDLF